MRRLSCWSALLVVVLVSCAKSGSSEPSPEAVPAPVDASAGAKVEAPPEGAPKLLRPMMPGTVVGGDPAALYQQCKQRVEGPDKAGECTTSADCVRTGCSSEVCASTADAAGMMTTCEVLPCFAVLDACGCVDGVCSWSVKTPG